MKTLTYNIEIFKTWFLFLVLRKPISQEVYDNIKEYYNATPREAALLKRIARVNGLKI
jgi:hypothetical protein